MGKFQDIISLDITVFSYLYSPSELPDTWSWTFHQHQASYLVHYCIFQHLINASVLFFLLLFLPAYQFLVSYVCLLLHSYSCSAISHFFFFFFTIFTSLLKSCHLRFYSSDIRSIVGLYFFYWISINSCFTLNSRHWV